VSGLSGVWVVTAVVATAYLGVGGVTAAAASPSNGVQTSTSHSVSITTVASATAVVIADVDETSPTSVPEAPAADLPVAGSSTPPYTPAIMMTGMVFLGVAILMVVRSGSARQVEEPE
jgi:hypothetical protein